MGEVSWVGLQGIKEKKFLDGIEKIALEALWEWTIEGGDSIDHKGSLVERCKWREEQAIEDEEDMTL